METYIAMLRGINVSGQKKINMADLKAHLEMLGFKNIRTYIQSGNVVFEDENTDQLELASQIVAKILKEYGFQVPVLVKNSKELELILKNNPFLNDQHKNIDILHVTFLSGYPKQEHLPKIAQFESNGDEFILSGDVIYVCCPHGYGQTKLNNNFFETKLKLTATTRNWKTVMKLAEMGGSECQSSLQGGCRKS